MTDFIVDVEADGPCPGLYSMISVGVVERKSLQGFYATIKPISDHYVPEALKVSGFSREQCLTFDDPQMVMIRLNGWLSTFPDRKSFWSDNNGFDWQFVNYYFHRYLNNNPFGHSSRRIGDFYSGLRKDLYCRQDWKKLRKTKHTHNALDDATGNAEALNTILKNYV